MVRQGTLNFDGETIDMDRDAKRLTAQAHRVWALMRDGHWRTLSDIACHTGDPEASVSARLRDFRKLRWGQHIVERRHIGAGLFEYRLKVRSGQAG